MTEINLFRQIVSDSQKAVRLKLKWAQTGDPRIEQELAELNHSISLKQALLEGLDQTSGNKTPPSD